MSQVRPHGFAAILFLEFAAFALIPTLASTTANHTSDLPYRKLDISHSEQGAQIRLFGMMPEMELPDCNFSLSVNKPVVGAVVLPSLASPPGCSVPHCPAGSSPGLGKCQPSRGQPLGPCHEACIDWFCSPGGSNCCVSCAWNTEPCVGCYTTRSCS
jgi:hypothetical protein